MATSDVPTEPIRIWETAVQALRKIERRLGHEPFTRDLRQELLAALTAVDDAWEEHVIQVRAWAGAQ
jgi:hypothetical protein